LLQLDGKVGQEAGAAIRTVWSAKCSH